MRGGPQSVVREVCWDCLVMGAAERERALEGVSLRLVKERAEGALVCWGCGGVVAGPGVRWWVKGGGGHGAHGEECRWEGHTGWV